MRTRPRHSWPAAVRTRGSFTNLLLHFAETCGDLRRLAEDCGGLRRNAETCGDLRRLAEPCGDLRRLALHANLLADDVIALLGFHKLLIISLFTPLCLADDNLLNVNKTSSVTCHRPPRSSAFIQSSDACSDSNPLPPNFIKVNIICLVMYA